MQGSERYAVQLSALGPYASKFRALAGDAELEAWLADAGQKPHGTLTTWLVSQLGRFVSLYDAHGMTGSYPMFLLSTAQWRDLIGGPHARLLDVGAGAGYVTAHAAPLFGEVVCTETSKALARRLERRGFHARVVDLASSDAGFAPGSFDVIACLNVLDRTLYPKRLLAQLTRLLNPAGRLLVAVPLPVSAHVHVASATISPEEPLPARARSFESAVGELARELFEPMRLEVERIARVPYYSCGDAHQPLYVLDDAVWVLRKR